MKNPSEFNSNFSERRESQQTKGQKDTLFNSPSVRVERFGEPYIVGDAEAIDALAGEILEAGRGAVVHAYAGSTVRALSGSTVWAHENSFVSAETGAQVFVVSSDARIYSERGAIIRIKARFARIKDWKLRGELRGDGIFAEKHGVAYAMPESTVDVDAPILLVAECQSTVYARGASTVQAEDGSVVYRQAGVEVHQIGNPAIYEMRDNCLN